jgi:hypothetical protein
MRWVYEMRCARSSSTPLSVTNIHTSMSLVYNIKRHQYTQLDVTNILASVSRLYSLVLKGYSHFCLRGFLRKNEKMKE